MNKRNIVFAVALACSVAMVGSVFAVNAAKPDLLPASANNSYTLTANNYNDIVNGVNTSGGAKITFSSSSASSSAGKTGLTSGGYIYNATKLSGITKIEVTLSSGSVDLYYGKNSSSSWDEGTSASTLDLEGIYPNYFKVVATSDAVIDKLVVTYACVDYQKESADSSYKIYVNGLVPDAPLVEVDKESHDLQLKAVLDLYPGDVISFEQNGSTIYPTAYGDGNNAYKEDSRGYLMVRDYVKGGHLYLKKDGGNYDVWLGGKGGVAEKSNLARGNILQAFNWSVSQISSNLDAIAEAGFTAIQISPLQARKWVSTSGNWRDEWWKLYQPMGFSVASNSTDGSLGTANDLRSLCAAAKAKGIGIIMDVVLNHLSGGDGTTFNGDVQTYEPVIYNNNLKHNLGKVTTDASIKNQLQGSDGDFPDLKTEDPRVMARGLKLLKDYLDLGVKGFRFDAAKHIETPHDGEYASSFWPYVINGAKRYAEKKGYGPLYCYGEIIGERLGRSLDWYTPYMAVTEASNEYNLREGVSNGNISKISGDYYSGQSSANLVVWAESHDQFKGGESSGLSEEQINKVYAIQGSRAEATALYFARPFEDTKMGSVGTRYWTDPAVKATNQLHSTFFTQGEYVSVNANSFVNARGANGEAGAMIVNICNSATYTVQLPWAANGAYTDLVTGNEYNVNNGYVTVNPYYGVAVLVPTSLSAYYLVGNSIYTGQEASWTIESGRVMTRSSENIAQITNIRIEAGAEAKIYRDGGTGDPWIPVVMPLTYDYCKVQNDNLYFSKGGTYSIFLNNEFKYYVAGTPDSDPEQSSSEESSSSESSSSSTPTSLSTVYVTNNHNWGAMKGYFFGGTGSSMSWPGVDGVYVGNNEYGQGIYRFDNVGAYASAVFNNGSGSQTVDISFADILAGGNNAVYIKNTQSGGHYDVGFWTKS